MKKWYFILTLIVAIILPCYAGYYTCKRCNGTGVVGTKNCHVCNGKRQVLVPCSTCNGKGEVRDNYGDLQKCHACNGWGKESQPCQSCGGSGEEPWICPVCKGSKTVYVEE